MTELMKLELIRKILIFSDLEDDNLRDVLHHCREINVDKGEVIVSENTPGDALYVIVGGEVKVTMISNEGKEIILSTLQAGDFFGEMSLLDGSTRSANVISISSSSLLKLSRADFLNQILPNPDIAAGILAVLSRRLRAANERIINLISLDAFDRLARYFQKEAAVKGRPLIDGSVVFERLPQSDIAATIGSSRETVTRMIREMVELGYIAVSGRSIILKRDYDEKLSIRHGQS
ncbi:MAG: Crp/Fnr family transcriptional regulator [Holophagae bacterium]|nr:Crp/Fnr family transcriptional regulator [Holophagae bacterium]